MITGTWYILVLISVLQVKYDLWDWMSKKSNQHFVRRAVNVHFTCTLWSLPVKFQKRRTSVSLNANNTSCCRWTEGELIDAACCWSRYESLAPMPGFSTAFSCHGVWVSEWQGPRLWWWCVPSIKLSNDWPRCLWVSHAAHLTRWMWYELNDQTALIFNFYWNNFEKYTLNISEVIVKCSKCHWLFVFNNECLSCFKQTDKRPVIVLHKYCCFPFII